MCRVQFVAPGPVRRLTEINGYLQSTHHEGLLRYDQGILSIVSTCRGPNGPGMQVSEAYG